MTRVCHLLDATCDWEQRVEVSRLLDRVDAGTATQFVASVDRNSPSGLDLPQTDIARFPARDPLPFSAVPVLRQWLIEHEIDVVYAWGVPAGLVACSAVSAPRVVVMRVFDPGEADANAKLLRAAAQSSRIVFSCATQTVRRRLVEAGADSDRCVVVRPGVDFARINSAANVADELRTSIGLSKRQRLLLAAAPADRRTGHERLLWGAHLLHHLDPTYRMVVCGNGEHTNRLKKLSASLPYDGGVLWIDHTRNYEILVAVADALLITPPTDVRTTAIAWAMAASTPIIGSAVPSIAELIAHKHTGLLIKPDRGPRAAVDFVRLVPGISDMAREKETARGQAYSLFGVRRYVDQTLRIYENVRRGAPTDDGISDPAAV